MNSRDATDEAFLRHCRFEAFRGPGPGGQKRNKTSSAVRLTHLPSGLHAIAGESRSQASNRAVALRRLRLKLAIECREPADAAAVDLAVSQKNEHYPQTVGRVLDVLDEADFALSPARQRLGARSSELLKFLQRDPAVWAYVQQQRTARGLHPLT